MFYNLHTHASSGKADVLEIVNQYPYEFDENIKSYSIGIHPWYINNGRLNRDLAVIEEKLQEQGCLALGECGLDKRIETPFEVQKEVFEKQLLLAKKYKKPVILHCVAAYQEIIEIKNALQPGVPMVIHGFSKNIQVAQQLLTNGFYLSFGKYLLRNPELSEVFKAVPDDRFFLETDTIQETISQVYEKAAQIKSIDMDKLKYNIITNFKTVFTNG